MAMKRKLFTIPLSRLSRNREAEKPSAPLVSPPGPLPDHTGKKAEHSKSDLKPNEVFPETRSVLLKTVCRMQVVDGLDCPACRTEEGSQTQEANRNRDKGEHKTG